MVFGRIWHLDTWEKNGKSPFLSGKAWNITAPFFSGKTWKITRVGHHQ